MARDGWRRRTCFCDRSGPSSTRHTFVRHTRGSFSGWVGKLRTFRSVMLWLAGPTCWLSMSLFLVGGRMGPLTGATPVKWSQAHFTSTMSCPRDVWFYTLIREFNLGRLFRRTRMVDLISLNVFLWQCLSLEASERGGRRNRVSASFRVCLTQSSHSYDDNSTFYV